MTREITSFQKKSAMTLASCSNPSRNGMLIRLDALCAVAAVYQGAHPCRYLPVGSGHSTLIKVSSIRSGGIGNRPITRASALSPLGLPSPPNILSSALLSPRVVAEERSPFPREKKKLDPFRFRLVAVRNRRGRHAYESLSVGS